MFVPDLSQFPDYATENLPTRSIGWLSGAYTKGLVPKDFLDKLNQIQKNNNLVRVLATAGFHLCEYCHPDGKIKECCDQLGHTSCGMFIDIGRNGFVWPEMLTHYVRDHGYKPPDEFVEWVINKR